MFMHFLCICTTYFLLFVINCVWYFSACFSHTLSLFLSISLIMAPKIASLLHPGVLFIPGHHLLHLILLPYMSSSVMRRLERTSRRTFLIVAFIRNARSLFRIFSILAYPLSFIVGVGSPFKTSRSVVPP